MTRTALLLLAMSLLAIAVPADAQTKKGSKARRAPVRTPVTGRRTFAMLNGMKVTLVHTGVEKKAVVALELDSGEIDEPPFGPGVSALMAGMLLEGTVARPAAQIRREASGFGTTLAVTSGPVITSLRGEVASENIARFVSLLGDVVRHPLLDTAGFERVRRNALRSLDSTLQHPEDLARQRWRALVFPGQPFGSPYSYPSTLAALQLGHVRNVYDDSFGGARAQLYISGVFDDAAVEHAVRDVFSDWKAGTPAARRPIAPVAQRQFQLVDMPGATRSTIWVGLPVIDPSSPDFIALEVTNELFARRWATHFRADARRDQGPGQGAGSALWPHRGAAYWTAVAEVSTDSTGAALDSLFAHVDRLRQEPASADELQRVKQALANGFSSMSASRAGSVSQLSYVRENGLGESFLTDYRRRVMAVSAEDIRRIAGSALDPARMTITVVGSRMTAGPQLARFRVATP